MPKLLLDRLKSNCIAEFRSASERRFAEAGALATADMRTAAIYLFGYVAEMQLKAAYFTLAGFAPHQAILPRDLQSARSSAIQLGVAWAGNLHNVAAWADFLVYLRRMTPGLAYAPGFDLSVLARSREIARRWRETLRYHENLAYRFELRTVQSAAQWFLEHSREL